MASSSYYDKNNFTNINDASYDAYSNYDRREDAPLPALPSHQPTSPLDDHTSYSYHSHHNPDPIYRGNQHPDTAYHQSAQSSPTDSDPWHDQNALPMRSYKHTLQSSTAPIVDPIYDDPLVRDVNPNQPRWGKGLGTPHYPDGTRKKKKGWFSGNITWVCYTLTLVQTIVFIVEIVKNCTIAALSAIPNSAILTLLLLAILTHSPIEIHPQFNPMIGPSPYVLINMGARYVPCMHALDNVQNATTRIYWPCPNATSTTGASVSCSLSDLCGFSGVPNPHIGGSIHDVPQPDQWFRFIVPIFLHAGVVHIAFNLLLQLTLGRDMERSIGPVRFFFVYFASGIFGFVLGGNFAATGIASTGCSGSLFGIMALTLLDLLYTWKERPSPVKDLMFIVIDVAISIVLGLLPGLDNFSHIGGFLMGLVLGVCVLRSPNALRTRTGGDDPPYSAVGAPGTTPDAANQGLTMFVKQPVGFFKGRRAMWWVWWLVRAAALLGALIGFILLLKNFYVWRRGCTWCKYLSCLVCLLLCFALLHFASVPFQHHNCND